MNYQANLKRTFNIDLDAFSIPRHAIVYFDNGNEYDIDIPSNISMNYDEVSYYVINRAKQMDNLELGKPMFYLVSTNYNLSIAVTTNVDYLVIGGYSGYVSAGYTQASNGTYYEIGDGLPIANYPTYNYNEFGQYTYGYYSSELDQSNCIYDFSSVKDKTLVNFRNDSLVLRGENVSLYHTTLAITNAQLPLSIGYGSPYYEAYNSEYERGFSSGYADGRVDGFDDGYEAGVIAGRMDENSATAMSYIGGAFGVVNNILEIEVLPHITLGLVFSIPLVFTLITLLFKLAKK